MIKRLFVLPLILLLICGCAEKKSVTPVLNDISFTTEIDYGDDEFMANAELTQDALKLVVTEPQEIKGLTLNITKNGVTAEFKGVTYTPNINSMPEGAIIQVLYNVLSDVRTSQNTAVCDEENCEIKGKVDSYEYEFEFSPSGLLISLDIDNLDLDIKFKNVTIN